MDSAKLPIDLIEDCLTALITSLAATSKLHLFTNNPVLSRNTVVGDFVEATFTGSAAQTVATYSSVYVDPLTGEIVFVGAEKTFIASAVATPEAINGWYMTDMAGTGYEGAAYFDAPINIANVGDGLSVAPVFGNRGFCP